MQRRWSSAASMGVTMAERAVKDEPTSVLGDPFEAFYRMHFADAVRLATLLVGIMHAEDVAQDAFQSMRSRLDELERPAAYLRVAVVNAAHQLHRSEGRRARRHALVAAPESVGPEHREVLDTLSALPHMQRTVLVLRLWCDWPDADIASAVGCAESTVRSHARRGLATLRKEMTR